MVLSLFLLQTESQSGGPGTCQSNMFVDSGQMWVGSLVWCDLGLTLDKLLEPPFPWLLQGIHNLNLTAWLGERNTVSLGQGHTDNQAGRKPELWGHILDPRFSFFPPWGLSSSSISHQIKLDFPLSLPKFSKPRLLHLQMVRGSVLLGDSCLYDDSIYIFSG